MSKIAFYRELKKNLEKDYPGYPDSLDLFVKNYVNDLTTIPSIKDALNFVDANYDYSPSPSPTPSTTPTYQFKEDSADNPWAGLGIPGFGPNVDMVNQKKQKNQKKS